MYLFSKHSWLLRHKRFMFINKLCNMKKPGLIVSFWGRSLLIVLSLSRFPQHLTMPNFIVLVEIVEKRHCEDEGGGYLQCTWWGDVQKRFINYCKPKTNTWAWNFTHKKNTWHQNFLHKITSILIYSIKQTLLMHAFVTVNKLIILVCPLMSLHPPLWSTFTHSPHCVNPQKYVYFC